MNRDILRSVGIFVAIALVLLAIVIGGVRFVKNRSDQYAAHNQAPPVAAPSNNQGQQTPAPQNQPKPDTSSSQPPTPQPKPAAPPQSTPAPTPQQSPQTETNAPDEVPITGPAEDMILTIILMMCAAYFGFILKRAKMSYRRLL